MTSMYRSLLIEVVSRMFETMFPVNAHPVVASEGVAGQSIPCEVMGRIQVQGPTELTLTGLVSSSPAVYGYRFDQIF